MFGSLFDDAFLPSYLFCFVFVFFFLLNPRPYVQSFFDSRYVCALAASRKLLTTCLCHFLFFCFVSLEMSAFHFSLVYGYYVVRFPSSCCLSTL